MKEPTTKIKRGLPKSSFGCVKRQNVLRFHNVTSNFYKYFHRARSVVNSKCPKCSNLMHEKAYESSAVTECLSCRSIWLTGSSITNIIKDSSQIFHEREAKAIFAILEQLPKTDRKLKCPVCHQTMDSHPYAANRDVYIDRCPNNHGLFLDGSELEAIQIIFEDRGGDQKNSKTHTTPQAGGRASKFCPKDGTMMTPSKYESEEIDICGSCAGVWCDDQELRAIIGNRDLKHGDTLFPEFSGRETDSKPTAPKAFSDKVLCATCGQIMVELNYCGNSGIFIHTCPNRHGVWLDRGELEKVQVFAERWAANSAAAHARHAEKLKSLAIETGMKHDNEIKNAKKRGRELSSIGRMIESILGKSN